MPQFHGPTTSPTDLLKKLVTATQNISGGGGGGGGVATRNTATNNAGDTTITAIAVDSIQHTEVITVGGVARTSNIAIPVTNRTAGDRVCIKLLLPVTTAIVLVIRNSTTAGTILATITTDTSGDDATVELEYDGAAWQMLRYNYPINTP